MGVVEVEKQVTNPLKKNSLEERTLISQNKPNIGTVLNLAEAHRTSGNCDEALSKAIEALNLEPNNASAYLILARTYLNMYNKRIETEQYAKKAIQAATEYNFYNLAIQSEAYVLLGMINEAIQYANASLSIEPNNAFAMIARIRAYIGANACLQAVQDATVVLKDDPINISALRLRAYAYLLLKNYDESVRDATSAIRLAPRFWPTWDTRYQAYLAIKKEKEAMNDLSTLIDLVPWYLHARKMRAAIYCDNKCYKEAIADASEVLKVEPRDVNMYCIRSHSFFYLGYIEYSKNDARMALNLDPTENSAKNILKKIAQTQKKPWEFWKK